MGTHPDISLVFTRQQVCNNKTYRVSGFVNLTFLSEALNHLTKNFNDFCIGNCTTSVKSPSCVVVWR